MNSPTFLIFDLLKVNFIIKIKILKQLYLNGKKVNNALALWATKNIADAYFELGFLPKAEEIYQSIQTEDTTLTMEVSLQLLSLYIEQDRLGLAF